MARKSRVETKYIVRRLLVAVIAVGFLAYFSYTALDAAVSIRKQKKELALLSVREQQQQLLNDELQRLIDSGDLNEQMERIAREKLGYARPGERIYIPES